MYRRSGPVIRAGAVSVLIAFGVSMGAVAAGADGLDPKRPGAISSSGGTPSPTAPVPPTFQSSTTIEGATTTVGLTSGTLDVAGSTVVGATTMPGDTTITGQTTLLSSTTVAGEPGDGTSTPNSEPNTSIVDQTTASTQPGDTGDGSNTDQDALARSDGPSLLLFGAVVVVAVGLGVMGIFSRKRAAAAIRRPIEPELIEQLYAANAGAAIDDVDVDDASFEVADQADVIVEDALSGQSETDDTESYDAESHDELADNLDPADDNIDDSQDEALVDEAFVDEASIETPQIQSAMTAGALLAAVTGEPEQHVPSLASAEPVTPADVSFLDDVDSTIAGSSGDESQFGAFLAAAALGSDPTATHPPVRSTAPAPQASAQPTASAVPSTPAVSPDAGTPAAKSISDGRGPDHLEALRRQVTRTEVSAQEAFGEASKLRVESARLAAQAEWSTVRESDAKREAIRRAGKDPRTSERALSDVAKYRREAAELSSQSEWAQNCANESRKLGLRLLDDAKRLRDEWSRIAGSQSLRNN